MARGDSVDSRFLVDGVNNRTRLNPIGSDGTRRFVRV